MKSDKIFRAIVIAGILAVIFFLLVCLCKQSFAQAPVYWDFMVRVNLENWIKRHLYLMNSDDFIWTVVNDTVKGYYKLGSMIRVDTLGTGTAIWFPEMPVVFKEGTGGIVLTRLGSDTIMISFVQPAGQACPTLMAGDGLWKISGGGSSWMAGNGLSKTGSTGGCVIVAGNGVRRGG